MRMLICRERKLSECDRVREPRVRMLGESESCQNARMLREREVSNPNRQIYSYNGQQLTACLKLLSVHGEIGE